MRPEVEQELEGEEGGKGDLAWTRFLQRTAGILGGQGFTAKWAREREQRLFI